MNNRGKFLYDKALESKLVFGTHGNPNAICINNASISKRNFKGKGIQGTRKDGRPFTKEGRRFTLNLTEDLFNAICQEKGECSYGIWAFGGEEDPDLKLYTIEVIVNMATDNPPSATLYTKKGNKMRPKSLNDTSIGILDEIYDEDIERVDLVLNPYDKYKTGHFTLYLRSIKLVQNEIEYSDDYWNQFDIEDPDKYDDEEQLPFNNQ